MKRGFTLIEILVVISIIGMLSSVLIAAVTPARAKARDGGRILQVRQFDNAVQLYKASNNGNAPTLNGTCGATASISADPSVCMPLSTASSGSQKIAWDYLMIDLGPYIKSTPTDPCGTGNNCQNKYGNYLGYTYEAPALIKYNCGSGCTVSDSQINESYNMYSYLESSNGRTGTNNYVSSNSNITPQNLTGTVATGPSYVDVSLSWGNGSGMSNGGYTTIIVETRQGSRFQTSPWAEIAATCTQSACNNPPIHINNLGDNSFRIRGSNGSGGYTPYSNIFQIYAQ